MTDILKLFKVKTVIPPPGWSNEYISIMKKKCESRFWSVNFIRGMRRSEVMTKERDRRFSNIDYTIRNINEYYERKEKERLIDACVFMMMEWDKSTWDLRSPSSFNPHLFQFTIDTYVPPLRAAANNIIVYRRNSKYRPGLIWTGVFLMMEYVKSLQGTL